MTGIEQHLESKLQERAAAGNLRRLSIRRAPADLYSNDYLGLSTNGIISNALKEIEPLSAGSTGSRLLSGNTAATEELEAEIAKFHQAEAALLFNSGYDANIGLLGCIAGRQTTILYDELCHASIIDGIRLSHAASHYKFGHNDISALEQKLKKAAAAGPVLVVVESVYSMDGDMAPLQELVTLLEGYDAALVVDEAHATGVYGARGEGLVCSLGLADKVFARVHTFGKALGCHGAAIVGSDRLKQYLINYARSFIYTTALPPHSIAAVREAYRYLSAPSFSNRSLHELITRFREKINASGIQNWKESTSQIQALIIGNNEDAKRMAKTLQLEGLQVNAILSPSVPKGMERLRICLHSFNTIEQADRLTDILNTATCSR